MWQITLRELRDRKWSLLAYSVGSLLILWIYVATFLSSQSSAQQLQELVKTYPKGIVDAFGLDTISLDTIEKYLNAKHFSLMWPLLAIILAMSRAGSQLAGEIQSGTMGLLLSLPLERWRIFAAKYGAGLITIAVFTGVSVYGVVPLAAGYEIPTHLGILTSTWVLSSLFMLAIYSLTLAVSASFSESGKVYALVSGILIVSYMLNIVALIDNKYVGLKYYSLFHYFDTQKVLATGDITLSSWLVLGGVTVCATGFALWRFVRRDVSV